MNINNNSNSYAEACENFDKTPKTVFAALAFSLAMRVSGNEGIKDPHKILRDEWQALYENKIVPQKPAPYKAYKYITAKGIQFEYGFIAKPSDMIGTLEPFRPCWNIQADGDGTQAFFDSLDECLEWADEWDQITA